MKDNSFVTNNKFRCEKCREEFRVSEDFSYEEMQKETKEGFGDDLNPITERDFVVLCEECFNTLFNN